MRLLSVQYVDSKICCITATCIHLYQFVSGYKVLVRDTCIRLHLSDVNAANTNLTDPNAGIQKFSDTWTVGKLGGYRLVIQALTYCDV